MQQLKASIDEIDKKIKEESDIVRRAIEGTYKVAVQQEASIEAKLESSKKDVLDLQDRSIRYNILKREVDTNRPLYDGLLQRLKEVGVEAGVGTNNVTVVDSALTPIAPFKPNLTLNLQIAAVLGLMLGIGLAFFLEYLDDTMQHPEDMERLAHLPVLGVIPLIKSRKGPTTGVLGLLSHLDARSTFAEAYRSVRTALQFSTREGAPPAARRHQHHGEGGQVDHRAGAGDQFRADRPAGAADRRRPAQPVAAQAARRRQQPRAVELPVERPARARRRAHDDDPEPVRDSGRAAAAEPGRAAVGTEAAGAARPSWASGSRDHHRFAAGAGPRRCAGARQPGGRRCCSSSPRAPRARRTLRAALKRLRQAGVAPIGAVMTKVDLRDGMYGYESAYYYYRSTNDAPQLT